MRGILVILLRHFAWLFTGLTLIASPGLHALPAEGFEVYALMPSGNGKGGKKASTTINASGGYVNPAWLSDYETAQVIVSHLGANSNVLSLGALKSLNGDTYNRTAYFIRYDLTFLGQSFDFKLAHIDFHYLNAGKNTLSLNYNAGGNASSWSQIYFSFGAYYRFSLNRWNSPPWSPVNFNTEDREWFLETIVGMKFIFTSDQYLTVDLNNRDAFYSYNGDFFAVDFSYNVLTSASTTWRLSASNRVSSWLSGTGEISEQTIQFGFIKTF